MSSIIFDFRRPSFYCNIERRYVNGVPEEHKDYSTMGSSDCNSYLPFSAIIAHGLVTIHTTKADETKVLNVIDYPKLKYSYTSLSRSYESTFKSLRALKFPTVFQSSSKGEPIELTCTAGQITDENNKLLLVTAIRKNKFPNIADKLFCETYEGASQEYIPEDVSAKDFIIIIGPELSTLPKYKNFYKQLVKHYLEPCSSMGIDILNTSDVETWVFKNNFKMPVFKIISQRQQYLQKLTNLI